MTQVSTSQHTNRLMNYRAAAEYIGVGYSSLRALVSAGVLPVVYVTPRTPRLDRADLDAYIEQQKAAG